jgi:hypothetical protein
MKSIEQTLTGAHPNSLGNTVEVVKMILSDHFHFRELFECYFSDNDVLRLRVSNAMKRIFKKNKTWLKPHLEKLKKDSRVSISKKSLKVFPQDLCLIDFFTMLSECVQNMLKIFWKFRIKTN